MAQTKMVGRGGSSGSQARATFSQLMPVANPVPPLVSGVKEPHPWLGSKKPKKKAKVRYSHRPGSAAQLAHENRWAKQGDCK